MCATPRVTVLVAAFCATGCSAVCGDTTAVSATISGTIQYQGNAVPWKPDPHSPVYALSDGVDVRWQQTSYPNEEELRIRFAPTAPLAVGTFDLEEHQAELCRVPADNAYAPPACVPIKGSLVVTKFETDPCGKDNPHRDGCPVHFDADLRAAATREGEAIALDAHLHQEDRLVAYTHCLADRWGH
jgi:hypothetical protein